ncbi:MAG: gamma-glutamyl-gamma-aminobutyrate hydrolase family protein [Oscillospiraceae bacterium]|nr:gamma-glutamyl-gamma-aminobutyrate hydrolase family protein [Oscillospiraceae bacterium]
MRPDILVSLDRSLPPAYAAVLTAAGARVRAEYLPAPDMGFDALLLAGGGDPDPLYYGQEDSGSHPPDRTRDAWELALFFDFWQAGKPIFGICRGLQLINIALGGTLAQDIPGHAVSGGDMLHEVRNVPGSTPARLWGPACTVNSAHHQVIDRLAEGLEITQLAPDGVVEGVRHRTRLLEAVQWHPERLPAENSEKNTADGAALLRRWIEEIGEIVE